MQATATLDEPMTLEQAEEITRCATGFEGFLHWCRTYHHILDKEIGQPVLFNPWPSQIEFLRNLFTGKWIWLVKARQVGETTCCAAHARHRCQFRNYTLVHCTAQDKDHAAWFIERFRFSDKRMPQWIRPEVTIDNTYELEYANESRIKAEASTERTARSTSADINIFDEASRQDFLDNALNASEPTVEAAGGQMVVLSTSAGPLDAFHRGWKDAQIEQSKYVPMFISWRARPGRTQAWYNAEKARTKSRPNYMKQEYPETPEEAFEAAGGRVLPAFSRKRHVVTTEKPDGAKLYRSLDWGDTEQHPFVCVWAWHDQHAEPALTFEPDCWNDEDAIEQMVAYSRDEDTGEIIKDNDDVPDAVRYLVTTFNLTGRVHVYRIYFLRNAAEKLISPNDYARTVRELSGEMIVNKELNVWQPTPKMEHYAGTVADRSRPGMRRLFQEVANITVRAHTKPLKTMGMKHEVEQGVAWLNCMLLGSYPWNPEEIQTDRQRLEEQVRRGNAPTPQSVSELHRHQRIEEEFRVKPRGRGRRLTGLGV